MELTDMGRSQKSPESGSPVPVKLPYPKAVFFIIATELSERFSYYGMRAVLTIYMRNMLHFSEDQATTLYHTFLLLCYGLPIVWGILADSFFGKFTTVWMVSLCFAAGNIVLMLSSIPPLHLPAIPLAITGLVLMSIGTGGMKPCVAPFGGEQFVMPQQEKKMQQFFSVFFFAMTVGNMISTVITPVFRRDVHCFEMDSCYPLAFGVPAVIMVLAVVIFVSGKPLYKINKPTGNVLVQVIRCITYALRKEKSQHDEKRHWLDRASDKFDAALISDIKGLLRVLVYYLPIPMFFALYEQLGSRWTLQATRMTGDLGGYVIKPDQMQVCNAILMFIFIPIFQTVVYPLFAKINLLKRPLQRMGVGGFLAAASFCVAGIVETNIQKSYYTPPEPMTSHVNFVNTLPCDIEITPHGMNSYAVNPNGAQRIIFSDRVIFDTLISVNSSCSLGVNSTREQLEWKGQLKLIPESLQSVMIYKAPNGSLAVLNDIQREDFKKSNEGNAKLRVKVINLIGKQDRTQLNTNFLMLHFRSGQKKSTTELPFNISDNNSPQTITEMYPSLYFLSYFLTGSKHNQSSVGSLGEINLQNGASYLLTILVNENGAFNYTVQKQIVALTLPNNVHMLWLLPQYILMAWAEIFFIVSGMEFSFTQAPASMKSVLQSLWHLMNAMGNVIVILSAQAKHRSSSQQATEFFGFSGAMFLDTIIFCLLAMRYKYVVVPSKELEDKNANH